MNRRSFFKKAIIATAIAPQIPELLNLAKKQYVFEGFKESIKPKTFSSSNYKDSKNMCNTLMMGNYIAILEHKNGSFEVLGTDVQFKMSKEDPNLVTEIIVNH